MLPEKDRIRALHMIESSETALEFIADRQVIDLDTDVMLRFALVPSLEKIGETASKVRFT